MEEIRFENKGEYLDWFSETYSPYRVRGKFYFKILKGVLEGCVLPSNYVSKHAIYFKNPFNSSNLSLEYTDIAYVPDCKETVIPQKVEDHYEKLRKTQQEGVDRYGGTVYIDSLVAYHASKRSADESIRFGLVTHITKAGVVTVNDLETGELTKLSTSKRHLVIDDGIYERMMILKLSK